MLTQEDILQIIEAQKQIFPTKDEFEILRSQFSDLQTSVDAYAKKADGYFLEMLSLSKKVNRHEEWLHKIAEKLGIVLEY
jgi:hypothetical protein